MADEQLKQVVKEAAIEHDEIVRIMAHYLWDKVYDVSLGRCDAIARGLIAELAQNKYIWEKVTQ